MELVRYCVMGTILALFLASQLFWFRRIAEWGAKVIPSVTVRRVAAAIGAVSYIYLFAYMSAWSRLHGTPTELTIRAALLEAPFFWWVIGSMMGFGVFLLIRTGTRTMSIVLWAWRRAE